MAPVFGYWKIRGLAQAIRFALEYTNTEYEEKLYECADGPEYNRDSWLKEKFSHGLDFPNLPYYIDGDLKITQSEAILRYIANKNGLGGKTPEENAIIDMIGDEVHDLRMGFARTCYNPDFDKLKVDFLKSTANKLKEFSALLGNKNWLTGDEIRYPDFHFYDMLDSLKKLDPGCVEGFPNLKEYTTRFENLERIKKYRESDRFIESPLNNKVAKFGNK